MKTIGVDMFFILRLSFILKLSVIFYTFHAVPAFKQGKCGASFQSSAKEQVESAIKRLGVENFIKEYKEQEGYVQLSESLTVRMDYIYKLVSGSLKKEQMSRLKWQMFQGTTEEFSNLKITLFDKEELKKIIGMGGYVSFADQYFEGEMQKTYHNVSAVLAKSKMARLKWQMFQGTTEEFSELKRKLFNKGEPREKYTGMEGYVLFADQYFEGEMQKTYMNVSAVLAKSKMDQLKWRQFQGTTEEFSELKRKLFNKGEPREKYTGMEGYVLFADQYFEGEMQKTYINVSAVLAKSKMDQLDWQGFQGTTKRFSELRDNLLNEGGELKKEFTGMEGYVSFAAQYFEGNMQKTYINVSAVLAKSKMDQLKWRQFQGTTKRFSELRGNLLNEEGEPREKYTGMEGYVRFADQNFEGDMLKTYINVSAVLGGAEAMQELGLGWKKGFQGAADQYRELKELFDTKSIEDLRDRKGQEYAADTIFKGNTRRTYRNVSVLREELLGSWEAFKKLNWQRK